MKVRAGGGGRGRRPSRGMGLAREDGEGGLP